MEIEIKDLPRTIVCSRRGLVRIAAVRDEEWIEGNGIADPEAFVSSLRGGGFADIFTFARPLPNCERSYSFQCEWDNVAVAVTDDFARWWESLPQETRKNVRRSQRRGVTVRRITFDDELAQGISRIYNETPIRQGRRFPHYEKSLSRVKEDNASYLDRATFVGAFFNGELIGFIKFVMVNDVARIMQIVALDAHTDKRPTNALLAKAVEICCQDRATHLIYGKYVYGRKENSPVTVFKKRNGFEQMIFPRYYAPLTALGTVAIRTGFHRGLAQLVPEGITTLLLNWRAGYYRRRYHSTAQAAVTSPEQNLQRSRSSAVT